LVILEGQDSDTQGVLDRHTRPSPLFYRGGEIDYLAANQKIKMRQKNMMLAVAWLFVMASVSINKNIVVQSLMLGPTWRKQMYRFGWSVEKWYEEAASQRIKAEKWRTYWNAALTQLEWEKNTSSVNIAGNSLFSIIHVLILVVW